MSFVSCFSRYSLTIPRWLFTLPKQRSRAGKPHHSRGRNQNQPISSGGFRRQLNLDQVEFLTATGDAASLTLEANVDEARYLSTCLRQGGLGFLSWDITKLAGPIKGTYYDCYVMIDIYSRYIVGAHVHASESGELAVEMMKEIFGIHGVPHVVHADRGTSMTSKTVAALLSDLEVTKSHSRPRVSNDNPYSEAWFKTLKFAPVFRERFGTLG